MGNQTVQGLKTAILDYCANDFECLEDTTRDVTRWMEEEGLLVDDGKIINAIVELVESNSIGAYILIPGQEPKRIELSEHWTTEEGIYFYTTMKGLNYLEKGGPEGQVT